MTTPALCPKSNNPGSLQRELLKKCDKDLRCSTPLLMASDGGNGRGGTQFSLRSWPPRFGHAPVSRWVTKIELVFCFVLFFSFGEKKATGVGPVGTGK